jgi:ketosteroid isomerase-like protein
MKGLIAGLLALMALGLLVFFYTAEQAPPLEGLTAADQEAIHELGLRYQAAAVAGDWAAWTDLWTTDAVYQVPQAPALVGHEQIMAEAEAFGVPTDMTFTIDASDGSGPWAWARGTWSVVAAATGEMPVTTMEGSYLWVLKKQADGTWLIDSECYNLDAPMEMPPEG